MNSPEDAACQRDYGRALLSLPSAIIVPAGAFPCSLEDLSLGGARICTDREMEPGDALWLKLDKLKIFGVVRWVKPGEYGLEFEEHLPKTLLLHIQGYAVDPEEFEAAEAMLAARNWVLGIGGATRTREMRLLDVIGVRQLYETDSDAPQQPQEQSFKQRLRHEYRARSKIRGWRIGLYLAAAAIIGALLGIGSVVFG